MLPFSEFLMLISIYINNYNSLANEYIFNSQLHWTLSWKVLLNSTGTERNDDFICFKEVIFSSGWGKLSQPKKLALSKYRKSRLVKVSIEFGGNIQPQPDRTWFNCERELSHHSFTGPESLWIVSYLQFMVISLVFCLLPSPPIPNSGHLWISLLKSVKDRYPSTETLEFMFLRWKILTGPAQRSTSCKRYYRIWKRWPRPGSWNEKYLFYGLYN